MDQAVKEGIEASFRANINRVRNLVAAYDALGTPGPGRPAMKEERTMLNLKDKVEAILRGLDLESPEIDVYTSGGSLFATVVSRSFTGMDEAERQRQIWAALRQSLGDQDRAVIEFVFTYAPEEKEPADEAV